MSPTMARFLSLPVLAVAFAVNPLVARPPTLAELAAPRAIDLADLPSGFSEKIVARGITGVTAMTIAPDGRVFICEQTGSLRIVKDDVLLDKPFVTLKVDSHWERGLIGVALDPDFPTKPYIYLCHVAAEPYPHHRVSRFTARGDEAVPGSVVLLWKGDDQTRLGGRVPAGHQGGGIHFGKDGKLYIGIGEQTAGAPAQRLDSFLGKLLRINPDGSIPEDNPFFRKAEGKYRAIWALGLRNPFAFAVQPGTGRIFINDVGEARWEEINEGVAGGNYGWPHAEGPGNDRRYRNPVHAYDRSQGRSITGGVFYNPPVAQFPREYVGKYFFAEYIDNWIRVLDPDKPQEASVFATSLAGPVDLRVAPDGSLYYLNRNVWVKDGKFKPNTGSLHRIQYTARSGRPAPVLSAHPEEQTTAVGQQATFRVRATGKGPLTYQWQRNGVPIPKATSPNFTLARVIAADSVARFRCVVSNAFGGVKSKPATLWVERLRAPADSPGSSFLPGLEYAIYTGRWSTLPDFTSLRPVQTGTADNVDLAHRPADEHFGMVWKGFVEVAREGAYTFSLRASGTAKMFVAGAEVAHSHADREGAGLVGLARGKHALLVLFAHGTGRPSLEVHYAGADFPRRTIPATALFRTDSPKTAGLNPAARRDALPPRQLVTTLNVPPDPVGLPPLLSQTGVFRSLAELTPNPGFVPYEVNSSLWSDGAVKRRWIALRGDERVGFAPAGEWRFPSGTVFVKHFEMPARRLETRLLVVDRTGFGYGVTYKWRADQSDADLLADGLTEELEQKTPAGPTKLKWSYPSRNDCLVCHTRNAGFVLGVNTRQLNGKMTYPTTGLKENQLLAWSQAGLFDRPIEEANLERRAAATGYRRLVAVTDRTASLEHKVRSYLDANCAQCHRPGGTRGDFDLRFDTPLARQKLLGAPLLSSDLGVSKARLVTPGDPSRSMLYLRMARRRDAYNMPPLATHLADTQALEVLAEWIRGLPAEKPRGRK